jgi:dTDP-4-amino-4,6-dideoxygalactose transaminase
MEVIQMNNIQLFKPVFHKEEILKLISECFDKGWTGIGYLTCEIEKKWCEYTGLNYSHFINSATAGLHLAVNVFKSKYNWQDGDEIISTAITFVSTNHAICYEKLSPVFADVLEDGTLDPVDIKRKITSKTKAIMFVGLGGNLGKFNEILEICKEKGLILILDAAHMAGSRYKGKHIGIEADCIIYSFQAVKNLPTADSGMVCFKEKEDDEICRQLSWLGISRNTYLRTNDEGTYKWRYDVPNVGYKYNGNSIMAAIALVELKYLDTANAYRRTISKWYRDILEPEGIKCIVHTNQDETSQHLFQILVDKRDELMIFLNSHNIYPGVHYVSNNLYDIYKGDSLPTSEYFSSSTITLPIHLELTKKDVEYICEKIILFKGMCNV